MNLNSTESNIIKKLNYRDLIIFIVPVLIFSLYLFVYNPGILTTASFAQLHQIATGKFTNAFPMLHTLIETLCLKIYASPISIGILQALVFSLIWMVICNYHRDDSTSDEFVLQFAVTLIVCLIPINAYYSATLSANVLFSYALMFLCFLIKVLIDRNGEISTELTVLIGITLACITGFSIYGIYIAMVSLIIILAYAFYNNASQVDLIKLGAISIVCILLVLSLNMAFDVSSDTTGIQTNDAFEDGVNLENARSQFFSTTGEKPTESFENLTSANGGNSRYDLVNGFVSLFRENFILDALFNNPILYMVFSVILLGSIYFVTKREDIFLVFAPAFINIITVLFTGQNNLYSSLLIFYLLAIIFISMWHKLGLSPQDIGRSAIDKPEGIAGQAISEPEEIAEQEISEPEETSYQEYEDDYSDLEPEIEETSIEEYTKLLSDEEPESKDGMLEIEPDMPDESTGPKGESDLLDEILKEIEMEKKSE